MAEDDLSDVVGGPEEARGGDGEGSVPQGAVLGPVGWGEKVGISGEWGSGEWRWRRSVMYEGAKLFSALKVVG
jgi:hypothetical protein